MSLPSFRTRDKSDTIEDVAVDNVSEKRDGENAIGGDLLARDHAQYGQTRRGLKSRHIQLIALGGCIGTGLFIGTGATLSTVGPAPLFMGMNDDLD